MKTKLTLLALSIAILGVSCKMKESKKEEQGATKKVHWGYDQENGPEHWAEIDKDSIFIGKHQSPINIIDVNTVVDKKLEPINLQYSKNTKLHDVTNNGHTIQFDFEKGDYILYKNQKYFLKQFHFHEAAEHTIDGIEYPIEIHMVHKTDSGKVLVLSIMAKEGKNSAPFDFLESYLPLQKGETKPINKSVDLATVLPSNKAYYYYEGSLTTPPCTEGVSWIILKEPITISYDQLVTLKKLMPLNNYRNVQPLNDRVVSTTN